MNENDKNAGVLFEEDLFIYFKYHKDSNTVEVYKNGELISSGGGVTPEQLYEILQGYVSKPELVEALSSYLTQEDLEGYVTNDALVEALSNYLTQEDLEGYVTSEGLTLILNDYVTNDTEATDENLGLVKINSAEFINLNENGQLEIGGRLGQFVDGGLYYPTDAEPTMVKKYTLMITDGAKNLSVDGRTVAIMAGIGLTCKNAVAGTTEYHLTNSQSNRFYCFTNKGGRLSIDQEDARINGTAQIIDISFANGEPISAYYGPTESGNDIIITVDRTVNPEETTKKLRIYGNSISTDVILVGQGNSASGGKVLSLGQACFGGGNQVIAFGNSCVVLANNSVAMGHTNLVTQPFCFATGQGHDFTNAEAGTTAVGICSDMHSDTAFAVGNGVFNSNGNITRSNALEVLRDGTIVLKSPNGTRYKIAVADDGTLTTTAIQNRKEVRYENRWN